MKPVRIDDLFEYSFLSSVEVSPTGEHAAFVVKSSNVEKNEYRSNLYLLHLMRGRVTPLSTSGKDGPFAWDPSGEAVLFASTRDEDATGSALYRIALAGGEAEHVMTLPHKADSFRPLPDGRILFTARVPLDEPASGPTSDADDYEVLEEIPFWQNGKGFTSRRRVRLFLFDPAGGDLQVLTEPELEVQSYDFIDGQVACVARRFCGKAALTEELWLYALETSDTTCLSRDELALSDVSFLDRDHVLVLASDMGQYGRGQNRELLLYALPDRTSRSLTPHWDRSVGNSVCADCRHGGGPLLRVENGSIYMIVTEGGQSKVVRISLSGEIVPVAEPNGSVDAFAVAPQGILCIELHPDALQELYLHDDSGERRLTSLNEDGLADRDLSLPEPFTVLHESTKLDAWIVKPIGFDPNARCPTILTVHGGPRAAFGDVFFH